MKVLRVFKTVAFVFIIIIIIIIIVITGKPWDGSDQLLCLVRENQPCVGARKGSNG